jgi:hypothetical protein
MSYLAYICYNHTYDDDNELIDENPEIRFEEPSRYRYSTVVPITFEPLHSWSKKDVTLFSK